VNRTAKAEEENVQTGEVREELRIDQKDDC
jgi:hypothetical protein